jgi:hypothetical protein
MPRPQVVVTAWLERHAQGGQPLLRYVGLAPE